MRKLLFFLCLFAFGCAADQGQTNLNHPVSSKPMDDYNQHVAAMVDSLIYSDADPMACDNVSWRIIKAGKPAIPLLLERLTDLHLTKGGDTLGDVALQVLQNIVWLPYFAVTGIQCCTLDCDLNEDLQFDRARFSKDIRDYCAGGPKVFKFRKSDPEILSECAKSHHITGQYELKFDRWHGQNQKSEEMGYKPVFFKEEN